MSPKSPVKKFSRPNRKYDRPGGGFIELVTEPRWEDGVLTFVAYVYDAGNDYTGSMGWTGGGGLSAAATLSDWGVDKEDANNCGKLVDKFNAWKSAGFESATVDTNQDDDDDIYISRYSSSEGFDPNYCEQCGDYADPNMTVYVYRGDDKIDSYVSYTGAQSCFGGVLIDGSVASVGESVLEALSLYRSRFSAVEAVAQSIEQALKG